MQILHESFWNAVNGKEYLYMGHKHFQLWK